MYYDVNKQISYYKEGRYETIEEPKLPLGNVIVISDDNNSNKNFIYISFKENILYDNTKPMNNYYTCEEDIPKINWQITNETKNTDGFALTKAETSFRGRTYEVWFSYEYPLSIGPWKFQGLPGLIFEVIDQTEPFNYRWQLKKISAKKGVIPFTGNNIKNVITSRELLQNFKEEQMREADIIMSRTGVEYEPISLEEKEKSFNNYRQLKREIKYEWEK